ncbi:MAG: peptidoglycan DD-metalloendopeptidase family protein [Ilumatobacter sp.]|uniref:M23 family metallopeptidase n=1 Tax=Ilumatobacter sp. TaxID=1967498 RepID=UPI003298E0C3
MSLTLTLAVARPSVADADHGGSAAQDAAAEIQAARDRADTAAQALFDKESEIDQLEVSISTAEVELAQIEGEAEEMREGLEYQAVRQFVGAGPTSFPLLIDLDDANDSLSAGVYGSVASETANVDLDDFDAVMTEVDEQRDSLASRRDDAEEATRTYAVLQETAEAEVELLGQIEARRLQDEAVQHELDEQQRQREERERLEREATDEAAAAVQAAAVPATVATPAATPAPPPETDSPLPDQSRPATTDPTPPTPPTPIPTTPTAPSPTPAPAPEPSPTAPVPPTPAPDNAGSDLACPIAGPRSFADTWGASRSGGRSHEGVDMMSPGGTPLVAMEAGRVEFKTNNLGGNTVRLYGASGTRYYYAHLSSWEGSSRPVAKGDVIGYVGKTGNTSANHLHLQVHPGGGQAVNPYPYARRACG